MRANNSCDPSEFSSPEITVHTELHGLGGWVHITGKGFTLGKLDDVSHAVDIYFEGLEGRSERLVDSFANTDKFGEFALVHDARCWPNQAGTVKVIAVRHDDPSIEAEGSTTAFSCG